MKMKIEIYDIASSVATEEELLLETALMAMQEKIECTRYDRINNPKVFEDNKNHITPESNLPVTLVDGVLVKEGIYPTPQEIINLLPESSGCCGGGCCKNCDES